MTFFKLICFCLTMQGLVAQDFDVVQKSEELRHAAYQFVQGSPEWIALLDRAIHLNPQNARALRSRAVWEIKTGSYIHCFSLLDRAVAIEPEIVGYRGWLKLFSTRDYSGSIQDLEDYHQVSEWPYMVGDHTVFFCLGLARKQSGDLRGAINMFDKDISTWRALQKSQDWETPYFRGVCHFKLGQFEDAIADFNLLLQLRPNCPEGNYFKGLSLKELGKIEEAQRCLASALTHSDQIVYAVYLERFDQIYPADIQAAIANF